MGASEKEPSQVNQELAGARYGYQGRAFRGLRAWQQAMELAAACHVRQAALRDLGETAIADALLRYSVLLPGRVATAHRALQVGDRSSLVSVASSLGEIESLLLLLERIGLADTVDTVEMLDMAAKTGRLVNGMSIDRFPSRKGPR